MNEAYWTNIDFIVQQAAARGMLCVIFPAYEGYGQGNQGWYQRMAAQGPAKLQSYGAWLANRYLAYDNILWVHGGDNDAANPALTRAVVTGIDSVTTKWLHAWHGARDTMATTFWANDFGWLKLNTIYDSESNSFANAQGAYNASNHVPFARIEDTYENPVNGVSDNVVRGLAWGSAVMGGTGAIYGDVAVWRFNGPSVVTNDTTSWVTAMNRPVGSSMQYLRQLFESKAWTKLVPDSTTRTFLTSGWGSDGNWRFAALANDGSFAIAYAQGASSPSMTFAMNKLAGPNVLVRWYDVTNGTFVTDGTYTASGTRSFSRNAANSQGDSDWALLFESM